MKAETRTIVDYWIRTLEEDPEAPALVSPDGLQHSRIEIDLLSQNLMQRFTEAGFKEGETLLLCLPNGLEWLGSFIACAKLGVVSVFADPGTRDADLSRIATTIGARSVFTSQGIVFKNPVRIHRFRRPGMLMGKLTSGSTGVPKCLYFTHAEMLADGELTERAFGYGKSERILGLVPWGHAYGLGTVIMPALRTGHVICGLDSPLPARIEEVCGRLKPSVFPVVPTIIRALVASDIRCDCFGSVRILITAGAKLDPTLATAFYDRYGLKAKNLYGSSETGSIACDPIGDETMKGDSVGWTIEGVTVVRSRSGRLKVCSPAVYSHQNRQSKFDDRFSNCMGDFGYVDEEGRVVIQSRAKGFVKIGEKRIGLADVESRLLSVEGVRAVFALGLDTEKGQVLAAAIESSVPRKVLSQQIRESLPPKCRPKVWEVMETLPATARGKVSKTEIQKILCELLDSRTNL